MSSGLLLVIFEKMSYVFPHLQTYQYQCLQTSPQWQIPLESHLSFLSWICFLMCLWLKTWRSSVVLQPWKSRCFIWGDISPPFAPKFGLVSMKSPAAFFVHSPNKNLRKKIRENQNFPCWDGELEVFCGGSSSKTVDLLNTPPKAITISQFLTWKKNRGWKMNLFSLGDGYFLSAGNFLGM